MKKRERTYHTYRVMVALHEQIGMFDDDYSGMKATEVRHSIFSKVYTDLIQRNRIQIYLKDKVYYLFVSRELRPGVLLCKLAKEEELKLYKLSNDEYPQHDIEEIVFENFPFVRVIIHLENQAFLVEKNTTKFHNTDQCAKIVEQLFIDLMLKYNANVNVYAVTESGSFWKSYKTMDKVTKLKITINSPNLFEAKDKAEEIAQDFKDETNAQKTEIEFENKENGLKIKEYSDTNKGVAKFLTYIQNGGGKWSLHGNKKGKKSDVHSGDNKTVVNLPQILDKAEGILERIEDAVKIRAKGNENKE